MNQVRSIQNVWKSKPVTEGAGVKLKRVFGYKEVPLLDPFLLLDDFHSDNPKDYIAGFPWHPHRGIETITYILHGEVEHGDSLGNEGIIKSGDVQWMTAGSGIIHQEMPISNDGTLWGFQLWANLPASHKMMHPRYRDITKEQIPKVKIDKKVEVKIIAGEIKGVKGPVQDIVTNPSYFDVSMSKNANFIQSVEKGYNVFVYIIEGEGYFDQGKKTLVDSESLVLFDKGDEVRVATGDKSVRFLLVFGKPIGETVAWNGPIVMNTEEELRKAFEDYRNGTFTHHE